MGQHKVAKFFPLRTVKFNSISPFFQINLKKTLGRTPIKLSIKNSVGALLKGSSYGQYSTLLTSFRAVRRLQSNSLVTTSLKVPKVSIFNYYNTGAANIAEMVSTRGVIGDSKQSVPIEFTESRITDINTLDTLFDINFIKKERFYTKLKYSRSPAYDIVSGGSAALLAGFIGFLISEKFGIELVDSGDFYIVFMYIVFGSFFIRPLLKILSYNKSI